jgi:hypothetical protein
VSSSLHKTPEARTEAALFVAMLQIADTLSAQAEEVIKSAGLVAMDWPAAKLANA